MPIRLIGAFIVIYGFIRVFSAADPLGIVIAVAGSLVWQAGMFFEMRSMMFQRLQNASVETLMRSRPITVNNELTVAKVRGQFPAVDSSFFFLMKQDGYLSGIALPEWLNQVPDEEARYVSMALIAHPISYSNSVRRHDTALEAFRRMDLLQWNYLPVTDVNKNLVGVITREQIAQFLRKSAELLRLKLEQSRLRPTVIPHGHRPAA